MDWHWEVGIQETSGNGDGDKLMERIYGETANIKGYLKGIIENQYNRNAIVYMYIYRHLNEIVK